MDKKRMLRRMETFREDLILTDILTIWEEKLPCGWKAHERNPQDPHPQKRMETFREDLILTDIWRKWEDMFP
jgi:hypothetical protein